MVPQPRKHGALVILMLGSIASLLAGGFIVFADLRAVATHGASDLLILQPFILVLCPLGVGMLFVGVVGLFYRGTRGTGAALVIVAIVFIAIIFQSMRLGNAVRTAAFAALADRARPLINAIECYEEEFGNPPESLQALVPNYLPDVPCTGMGAYPEFRYAINPALYDGNPWVLKVFTPSGVLNFDEFFYYPRQNYPERRCGNRVERIRDWAYLHE